MLLAIDIGNSNIVFGVYSENKLLGTFRLETDLARTEDEFSTLIISCLDNFGINYKKITGIIISSVILSVNPIFEKLAKKYFNTKAVFVGTNLKSGVAIKIEQPKTLAPDILVGIVGAKQKYGQNCLVIDLGTATTMTILNNNNEYIGGIVYPGLKISANALASNAALLPAIDLEIPNHVICKETIQAMQAGLMYGYASMLDGMIERLEKEYGSELKIILTGGLSSSIAKILKREVILDEDLLLDGMNYLYNKNFKLD
ncbi:type III pantothenate kinase [Bacilli bacterium PM5-3]|nr:type III pantothenate kinase [Bacilli bacterium PM5-3]MDH6603569.1 type III pantothenate kinase [Bacilli bacterium PM5-9]